MTETNRTIMIWHREHTDGRYNAFGISVSAILDLFDRDVLQKYTGIRILDNSKAVHEVLESSK